MILPDCKHHCEDPEALFAEVATLDFKGGSGFLGTQAVAGCSARPMAEWTFINENHGWIRRVFQVSTRLPARLHAVSTVLSAGVSGNLGALTITNAILGVPYSNYLAKRYPIRYPKIKASALCRSVQV